MSGRPCEPLNSTGVARRFRVRRRQVANFGTTRLLEMNPAARKMILSAMKRGPMRITRDRTIASYLRVDREKARSRVIHSPEFQQEVAQRLARMTGDRVRIVADEVQRWNGCRWVSV